MNGKIRKKEKINIFFIGFESQQSVLVRTGTKYKLLVKYHGFAATLLLGKNLCWSTMTAD
jgi:hypothetical protein